MSSNTDPEPMNEKENERYTGESEQLVTHQHTKQVHRAGSEDVTRCGQPTGEWDTIDADNPLDAVLNRGVKPCEDCFTSEYHDLHRIYVKGYTCIHIEEGMDELMTDLPWSEETGITAAENKEQ